MNAVVQTYTHTITLILYSNIHVDKTQSINFPKLIIHTLHVIPKHIINTKLICQYLRWTTCIFFVWLMLFANFNKNFIFHKQNSLDGVIEIIVFVTKFVRNIVILHRRHSVRNSLMCIENLFSLNQSNEQFSTTFLFQYCIVYVVA